MALKTDSRSEAERKAPAVEAELFAYWEALAAGRDEDARRHYEAARQLAEAREFRYVPANELYLATAQLDDILACLEAVEALRAACEPAEEGDAIAGVVLRASVKLTDVQAEFFDLTVDRLVVKSEAQRHRWRLPRLRSVACFVEVMGDKSVDRITRDHALEFRKWWYIRIQEKGLNPNTANKCFWHLSDLVKTWSELKKVDLDNPFAGLRFKEFEAEKYPFSVCWIRDRLLAPGALDGLNAEARDVLLVMINTGARPSEILNAAFADWQLHAEVPHLVIRSGRGRALKTQHSRREIPLVGVSLDAARRLATAGGCARYCDKGDSWSAAVGKYLSENSLRETPKHAAYSLRYSFEDRLLEAGVDERIRVDLMGHKYGRPKYGLGAALKLQREAIERIAL